MKRFSAVILLAVCMLSGSFVSYKPVKDYWLRKYIGETETGAPCGYVDVNGKWKSPPDKYNICFTDTFRKMAIVYDQKLGCIAIDRNQERLFDVFWFDNGPDDEREGLFRIKDKDKMGFADHKGNVVVKPKYDFAVWFNEGMAAVNSGCHFEWDKAHEHQSVVGGKWGFINKKGEEVIPLVYDWAWEFENGKASVDRNDSTFVIDKAGEILEASVKK